MSAVDHGVCPHCGRADAVDRQELERFECRGCGARWAGVRYAMTPRRRVKAPIGVPANAQAQHLAGLRDDQGEA